MTLQQLIYFKKVAETLHFTKAAQSLYITQSALSYSISSLERELDVPLFVRESGKSISLTSFGKALVPLADEAIANFNNINETIAKLRNPMSGIVNIAYSYINGHRFVPQMFSELTSLPQFSEIIINFDINHRRKHFEQNVLDGEFDIAFSCTPYTEGLKTVPFAKQELFAVLPCNHALASLDKLTLEEIADETFYIYDRNRNLDKWTQEMFRQHGLKINAEYCEEWMEAMSKVSLGKGVAISPYVPFDDSIVHRVQLDDPMRYRDVYIMWPENRKLSHAVEYVRNCCLNFYDKPPLV